MECPICGDDITPCPICGNSVAANVEGCAKFECCFCCRAHRIAFGKPLGEVLGKSLEKESDYFRLFASEDDR
jgi:hypothetical protein